MFLVIRLMVLPPSGIESLKVDFLARFCAGTLADTTITLRGQVGGAVVNTTLEIFARLAARNWAAVLLSVLCCESSNLSVFACELAARQTKKHDEHRH